ncbi:MAG: MerR family transcriptional regulator [Chloroflexi bacterium]|nr:MerR family transcriptional regulator [Chloroflexota bacterium]MBV9132996.1 MerR family transcriptional regulator [Chloroflexota bacterium]MBV9896521.1 MerR family transcriptional regulator [Chloroflexota bacterium]
MLYLAVLELATRLRRIGEVAEVTGLTARAIRYYEELGLLEPAAHATGANRRYDDDDIERLTLIKQLRDVVGLSLAEIQEFLETETARRDLRRQYEATTDPVRRAQLVDRVEPVLRRRVDLLERKLTAVQALLEEERTRLQRVHDLQHVNLGRTIEP